MNQLNDFLIINNLFNNFLNRPLSYQNFNSFLKIIFCTFLFCSETTGEGGAILLSGQTDSSFYLSKICAYHCFNINFPGQFCYSITDNSKFHNISLVSISFCSPQTNIGYHSPIYIYNGFQNINLINTSHNYLQHWSGIGIGQNTNCNFKYSTISSTISNGYLSLIFWEGTFNVSNLNIINNTQYSSSLGIITTTYSPKVLFQNCFVFKNILNSNYKLFYISNGIFKILNCFIQNDGTSYNLILSNFIQTSTLIIKHFNSNLCQNDNLLITLKNKIIIFKLLNFYILFF